MEETHVGTCSPEWQMSEAREETVFLGRDHFGLFSILGCGTALSSLCQAPSRARMLISSVTHTCC